MNGECVVHFFKSSGKWYTTETCYWNTEAQSAMNVGNWREAVLAIVPKDRLQGMVAVVINSPLGFPAMVHL